jgi:ABC-type lipoprotein export system ATPase subunit
MTLNYSRGSEWRRWDLHIHTPGTLKNDQFQGSNLDEKWNKYYEDINNYIEEENCIQDIAVIGVTDYISIDNYKKVVSDNRLPDSIKLIIPNVEMRITPITGSGTPVNIHCLFNPDIADELENRFFAKLKFDYGDTNYSAARSELIRFGRDFEDDPALDEDVSIKKAKEQYVISFKSLKSIFDEDVDLRNQTIIVVSNKSNDGVSGCINHSDFFINLKDGSHRSQLEASRQSIYKLSDAIFSSNNNDRQYFVGNGPDSKDKVILKCGSLKPCLHGCDAHSNDKIFNPDLNRYCWIKADPTFKGLKQAINEPEDRFFIGEMPDVLMRVNSDKTRYIKNLYLSTCDEIEVVDQIWFKDLEFPLSKELTVIIGNKGSGKSAIADIIGLCADAQHQNHFLFLHKNKFKKRGFAERFCANIEFESGIITDARKLDYSIINTDESKVQYLPQNYFEIVCNEITEATSFRKEIENVVFQYVPAEEALNSKSFKELIELKTSSVEKEIISIISKITLLNRKIIELEDKSNTSYTKSIKSKLSSKKEELEVHEANKPQNPQKENSDSNSEDGENIQQPPELKDWTDKLEEVILEIEAYENRLSSINLSIEQMVNLKRDINTFYKDATDFIESKADICRNFGLTLNEIISVSKDVSTISIAIKECEVKKIMVKSVLGTGEIDDLSEYDDLSLKAKRIKCETKIKAIQTSLNKAEQEYQKYSFDLKKWEERKEALIGNSKLPDSIKFYEAELYYIDNNLSSELNDKKKERLGLSALIHSKKAEIKSFFDQIGENISAELKYCEVQNLTIQSSLVLSTDFNDEFLNFISKNKSGSFYGTEDGLKFLKEHVVNIDWNVQDSSMSFLEWVVDSLENDKRNGISEKDRPRFIGDQVKNRESFYDFIFSLKYLKPIYELQKDGKNIEALSPGEKGAMLLVFYLVLDKSTVPLVIDQPEDNLDNNSVTKILVPFIKQAKKRRQIIMITHNPNLAVVADAEQVIHVDINKEEGNRFSFVSGSIENPLINKSIVDVLEGTMPAFNTRKSKYHEEK